LQKVRVVLGKPFDGMPETSSGYEILLAATKRFRNVRRLARWIFGLQALTTRRFAHFHCGRGVFYY
jgi:hypothetical protein